MMVHAGLELSLPLTCWIVNMRLGFSEQSLLG